MYRYVLGFKEARFYLLSWVALITGSTLYLLKQIGVAPINFITLNAMQIGSVIEMTFLSFALADRLNILKKQVEASNKYLEKTVRERTKELGLANKKLTEISITDKLTGLKNRYYFDTTLELIFKSELKKNQQTCLLLIDIDFFKKINDTYGHVAGDNALKFIGERLQQEIREDSDHACRYGGEEFAIILTHTNTQFILKIAERIRHNIECEKFYYNDQYIPITVSIGAASADCIETKSNALLIRAADTALYSAKDHGRNCVFYFTGKMTNEESDTIASCQLAPILNKPSFP